EAHASVTDVNRQAWTGGATLLVHPADLYVGLRSARTFFEQGKPIEVEAIACDIDGALVAGRKVALEAVRLVWEQDDEGEWREVEKAPQRRTIESAADVAKLAFESGAGGQYRIRARIEDDRGRPNESEITVWVAGGAPPRREG